MKTMRNFRKFLSEHKHLYSLLLLVPILIWFKYLERALVPEYFIHAVLDDRIPFVKEFVVPYLIWFPYIAYGVIFTGIYSRRDFYKLLVFLACGMSVAYTVYMIYPNAQNLRPVITKKDPFSLLVKMVYATDTPANVCPSVHVINSIAVNAALQHSEDFARKIKNGRIASHILTILICLSTVFIKQHSVLDVGWGIVTGMVLYIPLYALPAIKRRSWARSIRIKG